VSAPTVERTQAVASSWSEIPATLRSLWRACLTGTEDTDVSRALTINFLGVAEAAAADALRQATDRLQRRTPCRAFLLVLDEQAAGNHAELVAATRCHGHVRDIVLEEIVLRLPKKDLPRVPGLLRPLVIDDLATHLFWAAGWPAAEKDFDTLAGLAAHTIVDSHRFGNPARELAVLAGRREQGARITDLNWLRLRPWRRAIAEAFERFAWQRGASVEGAVRHGRKAGAAAMLLAEWLHQRIGAAMALEPDGDANLAGPDRVTLKLTGVEVDVEVAVEITAERRDDQIVVHVTTNEHCYQPFAIQASRGADGDLLAAAIDLG
jgi:glucose-6-phosphate dehydrogenase assembly protein OpcA